MLNLRRIAGRHHRAADAVPGSPDAPTSGPAEFTDPYFTLTVEQRIAFWVARGHDRAAVTRLLSMCGSSWLDGPLRSWHAAARRVEAGNEA